MVEKSSSVNSVGGGRFCQVMSEQVKLFGKVHKFICTHSFGSSNLVSVLFKEFQLFKFSEPRSILNTSLLRTQIEFHSVSRWIAVRLVALRPAAVGQLDHLNRGRIVRTENKQFAV